MSGSSKRDGNHGSARMERFMEDALNRAQPTLLTLLFVDWCGRVVMTTLTR